MSRISHLLHDGSIQSCPLVGGGVGGLIGVTAPGPMVWGGPVETSRVATAPSSPTLRHHCTPLLASHPAAHHSPHHYFQCAVWGTWGNATALDLPRALHPTRVSSGSIHAVGTINCHLKDRVFPVTSIALRQIIPGEREERLGLSTTQYKGSLNIYVSVP